MLFNLTKITELRSENTESLEKLPKITQLKYESTEISGNLPKITKLKYGSTERLGKKKFKKKVKEESEKVGLKLNIQKTKIMTSGSITSWQIDGETGETCQTLFFWAPKLLQMVTAAMKLKDAYSLEGKL